MSDTSSETPRSAPHIDIKFALYKSQIKENLANSATGEKRQKLNMQIQADYSQLLSIKTQSPERWQIYLSLVKTEQTASELHYRIYRESTRQALQKAREALEKHPLYQIVIRLDRNNAQVKGAVQTAKELGKPYEEIPPDFQHAVEGLLNEAYTGYPVSSEEKTAA